jgi:hypothetical protein
LPARGLDSYLLDMREGATEGREKSFRRGMRELSRHRPDLAVRSLRTAADRCSAAKPEDLSRYLYWLAIALLRLDRPELALKSLASAQKLRPRGHARSAYLARCNEYGMCRRSRPELDDFYAFFSAQAGAYLGRKASGRFETNTEKDAVTRLLGSAWRDLFRSGKLDGLSPAEKLRLFVSVKVQLPYFDLRGTGSGRAIDGDFRRGAALKAEDRCSCGSGLPFMRCCGRSASYRDGRCE